MCPPTVSGDPEDQPPRETGRTDDSPCPRRSANRRYHRRALLAAGSVTLAALAGCPGPSGDGAGGSDGSRGSDSGSKTTDSYDLGTGRDLTAWPEYEPDWKVPTDAPTGAGVETEVLVENLEIPWDISVAGPETIFVSERVGRINAFDGNKLRTVAEPTDAIDAESLEPGSDESRWFVQGGEGGTLGIAAHPAYPEPPLLFVYYTYEGGNDERRNRIQAFDVSGNSPGEPVFTLVEGIPGSVIHNGGRLTFGPQNYLWATCGDGGDGANAQDLTSLGGKVLRMTATGESAPGNPDLGGNADGRIYSYGHRNPQGIVWLPDGTPVVSEHGPQGFDEFNVLEAGGNYGWPEARAPVDYLGSDYKRPVFSSTNDSLAPTGSLFYTGDSVPAWHNRMLTGGLISQRLLITTLTPDGASPPPDDVAWAVVDGEWTDQSWTATAHTALEDELGRIRHVEQGVDGALYLVTSNRDGRAEGPFPRDRDDVLVRLTQA